MPEYIPYNKGLYNKGNYNQRLMTVLAGVFQPASTVDADLIRIQSATSVVNASATTVADLARFLGFDCTIQGAATTTVADFISFLTLAGDLSASSTVSIAPLRQRNFGSEIAGNTTTDVTFRPFRSMSGRIPGEITIVPVINVTAALSGTSGVAGTVNASPVLFWEPDAGTAVAFVDGTAGAAIWSDVTVDSTAYSNAATPTSTWTEKSATQVTYV